MFNIFKTAEYQLIEKHYNNQKAKRSGVPLINHIQEGLMILEFLFPREYSCVREAYCLHPLFQSDEDLDKTMKRHAKTIAISRFKQKSLESLSLILVMEYRNIANQYLSHRKIENIEKIALSPLFQVNQMLIADKVQNRKDFELYHEKTHPKSAELKHYFRNWLTRLGVSEAEYQYYKKVLIEREEWAFLPNLSNGNGEKSEMIVYVFRDKNTKNRFRFDLLNMDNFELLHRHILEAKDGGYKILGEHPETSGYWKENDFVIGTYVNGESFRGMKDSWRMDFSKWMN